ncbi:MAG: ATP-binding cassette domain-containing protein [Bifidobacteriaceae bacterium]|nr:ATP-binding cassette domain-containing protein [Bifidobacteriaceae bacterium]
MSGLEFLDVRVRFGRGAKTVHAVHGVSLEVPAGQVVGLVGESGSGKSTLGRTAVGLAPLDGGSILIDGQPIRSRFRRGEPRPVQMVYQDPYSSLDPRMTVGDSIAEALPVAARRRASSRRAEVSRLLDLVSLEADYQEMLPGRLSGGQLQRIALARALGARPRYVVADEVTSALDVSVQGAVLNLVREVQRDLGFGMLFISHNLAVVRYLSDAIAVMRLGKIVEAGPTDELIANPRSRYTRALLAAAPHRRERDGLQGYNRHVAQSDEI